VKAASGSKDVEQWVPLGWQVTVPTEPKPLLIGYGNKQIQLPIGLQLKDFQSIGMRAPIRRRLQEHARCRGPGDRRHRDGQCWMNNPMSVRTPGGTPLPALPTSSPRPRGTRKTSRRAASRSSATRAGRSSGPARWSSSRHLQPLLPPPYPMDGAGAPAPGDAAAESRGRKESRTSNHTRRNMNVRKLTAALLLALICCADFIGANARGQVADAVAGATGGLDYHQFGLLGIQDAGRRKPLDTLRARRSCAYPEAPRSPARMAGSGPRPIFSSPRSLARMTGRRSRSS